MPWAEGGRMLGFFGISFPLSILWAVPRFLEKLMDDKGLLGPGACGILIAIFQ